MLLSYNFKLINKNYRNVVNYVNGYITFINICNCFYFEITIGELNRRPGVHLVTFVRKMYENISREKFPDSSVGMSIPQEEF